MAGATEKIRILIADDHNLVRRALVRLLQSEPDMEIVAEASDGAVAVEMARRFYPDVVLMDVSLPGISGIQATQKIMSLCPNVRVIGLSMFEEKDMQTFMRTAGAFAYVSKTAPVEELFDAIRAAHGSVKKT